MTKTCQRLIKVFAQFDRAEDCYELITPFPFKVAVPIVGGETVSQIAKEFAKFCQEHELVYKLIGDPDNMDQVGKLFEVTGLKLK